MCDVIAAIVISFAIIYFFVCDGCEAFSSTCKNYEEYKHRLSKVEKLTKNVQIGNHSDRLNSNDWTQPLL